MTPQTIKKPKSNFLIFCDERRPDIKLKNPEMKVTEVVKECSRQWSLLTDAERDVYTQKYAKLKEEYLVLVHAEPVCDAAAETAAEEPAAEEKPVKKRSAVSNGYIKFCSAVRSTVKAENPDLGPKDIMRKIGEQWNALSLEEKEAHKAAPRVPVPESVAPVPVPTPVPEIVVPAVKKPRKVAVRTRKVASEPVLE